MNWYCSVPFGETHSDLLEWPDNGFYSLFFLHPNRSCVIFNLKTQKKYMQPFSLSWQHVKFVLVTFAQ